ncbi:carotenoid 1,2-hydratase [Streptomyces sp. ID38640]|uniref:carotenoid 1,2-hydratase n=1 Tax=Streptomyces sp. ID38640 TaxID=1265399 RepID=UPI001C82FED1|nr:carotenoid 1,2-hydratase [Streptomyces sp. ID38640]
MAKRAADASQASSGAVAERASGTSQAFPTFVNLPADMAAHPDATDEWWFTVGHVSANGHRYGYEVVLTNDGMAQLAITDVTAGKHYAHTSRFDAGDFSVSSKELDVRMPDARLTGTMDAMHLTAKLPEGSLDLRLSAKGHVMYPGGNGLIPFAGGSSYYYSLPNLKTSGTLTLNGKTSKVTGKSWLDRQWGEWDWSQVHKWTWMAIQLDNGEFINLADLFDTQGREEHYATVLHRDGSQSVVTVEPLARDAARFETSPATGQRYAGKWTVRIPSLDTTLTVTARPILQEIPTPEGSSKDLKKNEAASSVSGTYKGRPVSGKAYVEQFGNWK